MINEDKLEEIFKRSWGRTSLLSRFLVQHPLFGIHLSDQSGGGVEFKEIDRYQLGDDLTKIHWIKKLSTSELYIKKFATEKKLKIILALDRSLSMFLDDKNQTALSILAALGMLAVGQNDLVEIVVFADGVKEQFSLGSSEKLFRGCVGHIMNHPTKKGTRTNLRRSLREMRSLLKNNCPLFIISDFIDMSNEADDLGNWKKLLKGISYHMEITPVVIMGKSDLPQPNCGLIRYSEIESGEEFYIDSSKIPSRHPIEDVFEKLGISYMIADPRRDYLEDLLKYLWRYQYYHRKR